MRNEKDYSAGGMEFSSPGREFSPPRQEFSPVRAEFSPPRGEFAPVKAETQAAGEEFAQTAAPVAKAQKKRRVSPLMVTAAAVATSVVVISGVNLPGHFDLPKVRVSADEAALLEAIEDAIQAQDTDALLELAEDPALRTLMAETVPAFYAGWDEDFEEREATIHVNDTGAHTYTTYGDGFSFDGTYLSAVWLAHTTGDCFFISVHETRDNATGETWLSGMYIDWDEETLRKDTDTLYDGYSFGVTYDSDGGIQSLSMHSVVQQTVQETDSEGEYRTWLPREISGWQENYDMWTYSPGMSSEAVYVTTRRETIEGDCVFAVEEVETEEGTLEHTAAYLENGTIVMAAYTSDGIQTENTVVEFRDGYEVRDGVLREDLYHTCEVNEYGEYSYHYVE